MNVNTALQYIAIFLVVCVVFSLVGVLSVSAASFNDHITFENMPLTTGDTFLSSWYRYEDNVNTATVVSGSEVYIFASMSGNNWELYVCSPISQTVTIADPNNRDYILNNSYNDVFYYSVYSFVSSFISGFYIPFYSTGSEGLEALAQVITSSSSSGSSFQYSLPPGNAIYIQVSSGASYTLDCRMPESVLGTNHYPGNNQVATLVQSLPSGGSAPSSPLIPWSQTGALSYLGLSRYATYSASVASSGYLCIVNPLYYSGTANGPYEFLSNGSIDITIDSQTGFWVYPLDSSLGFTSGLGLDVSTEVLDTPFTGSIDPDTGEIIWEDSDGGSSAPTTGGGNLVDTSETIFDFLRNISQELSTFLKGPVSAIQTVVSSIRDFMSSFTQLYTWLPSPVYNLITSALMIALTIGVIKIFI